jgi:hypothetical protein
MQGIERENRTARQKTCKARFKSYKENMQELERQYEIVIVIELQRKHAGGRERVHSRAIEKIFKN